MTNRFTPRAQEALERAKDISKSIGHTYIGTEHLLLGLMCTDGVGSKILDDKGALYTEMYDHVVKISGAGIPCVLDSSITPKCKKILEASVACAKRLGSNFIGTEHILYSICEENDCAGARVLSGIGISTQGIKNDIHSLSEAIANVSSPLKNDIAGAPMLSQFGKSLNSSALLGTIDPLIGRENDVLRLIQILCRRTKNNPCLIGEPGVGKTAIVEGLAQMIVDGRVPKDLEGKIIVSLDLSSVIAGTKYRGEFEERMRAILKEVKNNINIILFIDEIHVIMGAGGAEGAIDAANIIKPALSRGDLRIIGATTIDEYRKSIEKDSALERRFQPIMIDEPTETEAIEILTGLSPYYEAHHGLKITPEAISACVKLSQRYINDRFLPDKAIDLLDEACSKKRILACSVPESVKSLEAQLSDCVNKKEEAILDRCFSDAIELKDKEACLALELSHARSEYEASKSAPIVDKADIYEVVAIKTKIPVSNALELEDDSLSTLEKRLSESIIGQDEAISRVASAVKRATLGICSASRPSASFLFLGSTGVGKTLLAKELSRIVFKSKNALIRLDMSEYSERHAISKLIGAPSGYIGYDDGGVLCEAVRRNPYSVVLFDEIEKAHPDIYSLLLQILDEGFLTSSLGKKIDFRNTIIILTSNIGGEKISSKATLGFNASDEPYTKKDVLSLLKNHFSREFINRLDEIIVFKQLTQENAKKICSIMLEDFQKRARSIGVEVDIGEEAIDFATKIGFSDTYGARELQRAIIELFENPLCERLLSGEKPYGKRLSAILSKDKIYYK